MINYKEKFKKELEREINDALKHIAYLEGQIKVHLPKVIHDHHIKISNLKQLLKDIENNDSFTDPIFSYCNNEDEDYD